MLGTTTALVLESLTAEGLFNGGGDELLLFAGVSVVLLAVVFAGESVSLRLVVHVRTYLRRKEDSLYLKWLETAGQEHTKQLSTTPHNPLLKELLYHALSTRRPT